MMFEYAFLFCLDMEEELGRGRHGRESRAHGSARREVPPAPKRGRRKKGQPLFVGTDDAEAGGSRSRTPRAQVQAPVVDQDHDAGQYLNEDANWAEQEQPHEAEPEPQHQQPPEPEPEAEDVYAGGPTDLSLLSLYHKHRADSIWHAPDGSPV